MSHANTAAKAMAAANLELVRTWYATNTGLQLDCAKALGLSKSQVSRSLKIINTGQPYTAARTVNEGRTNAERQRRAVAQTDAQRAHLDSLRTGLGYPCRFSGARECRCCA